VSDSPPSLGPRLKAERERKALSSHTAADSLHLDSWVVDALEADDYERVGPPVYVKGHLKRYATLLELPVAEIIAAYESRVQAPKAPASQPSGTRLRASAPPVSNLPWPPLIGLGAAMVLAVVVLWWKPWHQRAAAPASAAASVDRGAAAAGAAGIPGRTPMTSAPPAPAMQRSAAAATPASAPASQGAESDPSLGTGRARLRLSFSASSWVDVHDAAGRRVFAGNGRANSVRTFSGMAPMRVYLGFASGVQLEINNRAVAIGPQFVAGDVARFEAGADGVLRRDLHPAADPIAQSRNTRPPG